MRRGFALLAAALVALTLAAPAIAAGGPVAAHSMLQLGTPDAYKEAMFAAAARAGASEIRVDASLGALNNPWIGPAMWQGLDTYMALSEKYSLPVLLDFNSSNDPGLESCAPGTAPNPPHCGVSDLTGYYREIAEVVAHVRGVIDDFEVVNEPDGTWAFTGTPQQYAGMLATAYNAVHATDPAGRVLLGGIMSPNDTSWLASVFTTPGFDAAHAFDIANVHLRDKLSSLAGDVLAWRRFFTFFGDGRVPLWVTEAGYPADPAFQYDPAYHGADAISGAAAQAAFITDEVPVLLFAGVARVFISEHDSPGGQYASEGLLVGGATTADEADADPIARPAYAAFAALCARFANAVIAPPAPVWPTPAPPADTAHAPAAPTPPSTPGAANPAPRAAHPSGHHTPAPRRPALGAPRRTPARPKPSTRALAPVAASARRSAR